MITPRKSIPLMLPPANLSICCLAECGTVGVHAATALAVVEQFLNNTVPISFVFLYKLFALVTCKSMKRSRVMAVRAAAAQ